MNKEMFANKIIEMEKGLYYLAKSILKNDEDCADAIQEAIVNAFDRLGTLRNETYFKTWLTRILMNECYKLLRERQRVVSYESLPDTEERGVRETESELYAEIKKLDETIRLPIVLFYLQGFSVKEISRILHISQGSAKTRLYRGRNILRDKLKGDYEYE